MQLLRLVAVTVISGGLCWFLGATVIEGLKTGSIRHTDSTRRCARDQNLLGFWSLVFLFTAFIIAAAVVWYWVATSLITTLADTA